MQLVCPNCSEESTIDPAEADATCSVCGSSLWTPVGERSSDGVSWLDALARDAREAFETSAFGLTERHARLDPGAPRESGGVQPATGDGSSLQRGAQLGDFVIIEEIGRGGMGAVYAARQESLDRVVALKVLQPSSGRQRSALRRFRTEAKAVARLNHPNVVPVYAQAEQDGQAYFAMELIEGPSLATLIRCAPDSLGTIIEERFPSCVAGRATVASPMAQSPAALSSRGAFERSATALLRGSSGDFRRIAELFAGVADGLAHAHPHGVVHRDVKPHNLLLGSDGRLRITDFGLAHLADEPHLTMTGELMGTAAYLAPEQVTGEPGAAGHLADIYALGATLYEAITGRRMVGGDSRAQIISGIGTQEVVRPRAIDARIPVDLETICLRAVEQEPGRRYATACAFSDDLLRFTVGRPIKSRRIGRMERARRWARRHRTALVALVGVAAALSLAVGLAANVREGRRARARSDLDAAYSQLAYRDYRRPLLAVEAIERADSLGVDPVEVGLARALAELGQLETVGAIESLHKVLERAPDDPRALYMLAWAQWRGGDPAASSETFRQAEELGGPDSADAWLYRGLAVHYDRPADAMASYRRANALRAEDHEFYPQALLHLARAYNQQLYVTRSLASFTETDESLRQLIANGYYGAYPHYLLSIAHRLAAETLEGAPDNNAPDLASDHFDQALMWAREGQAVDPTDYEPVTAEAECLESMRMYEEAIAARTRAIDLADADRKRWEGYHYRWRLYYWTGDYDAALSDLATCATFAPDDPMYAHLYPALIYAERGDMAQALAEARSISDTEAPGANSVLWMAMGLRLLGRIDEARVVLEDAIARPFYARGVVHPQTPEWIDLLLAFDLGQVELDDLLDYAERSAIPRKLRAEAWFHSAVFEFSRNDRSSAFESLTNALRSYDSEMAYTFHAKTLREMMHIDAGWPAWLPVSSGETLGKEEYRGYGQD